MFKKNTSHLPIRETKDTLRKSLKIVYMYSSMTDLARETNDDELLIACKTIWQNIVSKRMYITGGIGSTGFTESFTVDYDLPNDTAYAETCAAIGLVFFAHRMLRVEMKGCYADVMERALYNGVISGIALDGKSYFYVNPLEVLPEALESNYAFNHVRHIRQKWYGCACCPPNIARLLASLGSYIYSKNEDTIFVHLFIGGTVKTQIMGNEIELTQTTNYPWEGNVKFDIKLDINKEFTIALRVPGWCKKHQIAINEKIIETKSIYKDGYVYIKRAWKNDDSIELVLDMPVERMKANPLVRENIGKTAIQKGPIVYCLEETDNGPNLSQITLTVDTVFETEFDKNLLCGINVIKANAVKLESSNFKDSLYKSDANVNKTPVEIKFIPYYSWANRNPGELITWVREE